jgi:hypothetical protein
MTKIQLSFALSTPLDETQMNRIADLHGTYGILKIHPESGSLRVEYDATRFSPRDVEAALARAGLPLADRVV